ncbi:MAG: hypothetical protein M1825_000885 [Sarcosagium campestre]|nr:MAG: hypothetical protein M1825_000885 [Sarcosagium campestre]
MASAPRLGDLPPVAGVKRPAPAPLLPAFEPFSSPSLPRPNKRFARAPAVGSEADALKYPTPVPTSATGILSSSPPNASQPRSGVQRVFSGLSERAPLSAVPSITLSQDGEPILMGRSSNSSHYQLSANRLISRVHVRVAFIPSSSPLVPNKVEVICMGWNGVKVHCQGRAWELRKGDTFTSETEHDIILDVQDARVLVTWPQLDQKRSTSYHSDSTWDEDINTQKGAAQGMIHVTESSPLARGAFLPESPVSPSPAGRTDPPPATASLLSEAAAESDAVLVYEDHSSSDDNEDHLDPVVKSQPVSNASQPLEATSDVVQSSPLSDVDEFSDHNEENDPIIHSFGPQGDNLLPRMASVTTGDSETPAQRRLPIKDMGSAQPRSASESTNDPDPTVLANHIINQLAFSRLSSTPLSTILNHLPAELRGDSPSNSENQPLSKDDLKRVIEATQSIGEVSREGKDAAGKMLESEYYYIPDLDDDEKRREAVVEGLRKPGLRACRKQHKVCAVLCRIRGIADMFCARQQYFWRKPK